MTLDEYAAMHDRRARSKTVIRGTVPGITANPEGIPVRGRDDVYKLYQGSTPIFVLGVDNPDGDEAGYIIP